MKETDKKQSLSTTPIDENAPGDSASQEPPLTAPPSAEQLDPTAGRSYDFREQQIAALYEIGMRISALLDLKPILYSLYEAVQNLIAPEVFYIAIYDEATHWCEFPLFFDQGRRQTMPSRDLNQAPGVTGAVIQKRKTLLIKDTQDPTFTAQYQAINTGGKPIRTYVGSPMISHHKVIGVISMQKYAANAFTGQEIRLLETIAMHAAIAIENSQLYENAQRELKQRRQAQAELERVNQQLLAQIRQNEALRQELQEQAVRDPLTGLFNRRYLKETLEREVARARRDGSPIGILIMDIDEFKQVNDSFGHTAGDRMLEAIGELLKKNTRTGDVVCRYGGEEFVIVMPGASLQAAGERAELLRRKIEQLYLPADVYQPHDRDPGQSGESLHVTISLGVAAYSQHGEYGEEVLIRADRALYQAKQAGRNRVVTYLSQTKPLSVPRLKSQVPHPTNT